MNRRIPNGTYGGVRGRGLVTPSYSIYTKWRDRKTKVCEQMYLNYRGHELKNGIAAAVLFFIALTSSLV
ncbi:hypothetical protein [Bacillus sp. X1(2014)]|uniref:hypothetical protein n=1 Tax=Bacillus sp. X1(2014) TaxID=1565991 RepID=UPI001C92D082|nr:hypothetical protein [Bacillus sp. X1(2014)]